VEEFLVNQTDALPGDGVALSGKQGGLATPGIDPGCRLSEGGWWSAPHRHSRVAACSGRTRFRRRGIPGVDSM